MFSYAPIRSITDLGREGGSEAVVAGQSGRRPSTGLAIFADSVKT